jgi:hypothetical protein
MDRVARQGLVEILLALAVVALGAAGALALWGDELRALLGRRPPAVRPAAGGKASP